MCKETYLSVDTKRGKDKDSLDIAELSQEYALAASTSFYCLQNGLIRIPEFVRCTGKQLKQFEEENFSLTVPSSEVISLRRNKNTKMEGEQSHNRLHEATIESTSTDEFSATTDSTASFDSELEGNETAVIRINREDVATVTMLSSQRTMEQA
jgi:hypothetical protein